MEDQTSLSSELHRRNNTSIRRKPLNDDKTRNYGSEEDDGSPGSASNEGNQESASQGTGINAIIESLWWFLNANIKALWWFFNLPIVANAIFAFMIIQLAISIMEERQAARSACTDREHKALSEAVKALTNRVNDLTESMAAMVKDLEGL
ncbi:hypothetical protein PENDEC_c002G04117 [Penicillium decumbens]|uniref:Uncharacterized protein n=1 Tax=Penicillium decumbens TaxID=69771 RepID=A0A1V6PKD4_PENDC|nr:hypothetical protein PENDEC_c002G04117 [Penicillium decumbens]